MDSSVYEYLREWILTRAGNACKVELLNAELGLVNLSIRMRDDKGANYVADMSVTTNLPPGAVLMAVKKTTEILAQEMAAKKKPTGEVLN